MKYYDLNFKIHKRLNQIYTVWNSTVWTHEYRKYTILSVVRWKLLLTVLRGKLFQMAESFQFGPPILNIFNWLAGFCQLLAKRQGEGVG